MIWKLPSKPSYSVILWISGSRLIWMTFGWQKYQHCFVSEQTHIFYLRIVCTIHNLCQSPTTHLQPSSLCWFWLFLGLVEAHTEIWYLIVLWLSFICSWASPGLCWKVEAPEFVLSYPRTPAVLERSNDNREKQRNKHIYDYVGCVSKMDCSVCYRTHGKIERNTAFIVMIVPL